MMALSYKSRRRWAQVMLLVGLPIYIRLAATIVGVLDRPYVLVERAVYVIRGSSWSAPFKRVFIGIGQADPDEESKDK